MLPARSMDDLSLPDDVTRPDFTLSEHYQGLSKELSRLALLGIAGYGFLIKEVAFKGGVALPFLHGMVTHFVLMLTGLLALGVSAAASLRTAQVSTNCIRLQIDILRYVKRRTNPGWTDDERLENDRHLEKLRKSQQQIIASGRRYLKIAVTALIVGMAMTVLSFGLVLAGSAASSGQL
jgi:hypothetical protein